MPLVINTTATVSDHTPVTILAKISNINVSIINSFCQYDILNSKYCISMKTIPSSSIKNHTSL